VSFLIRLILPHEKLLYRLFLLVCVTLQFGLNGQAQTTSVDSLHITKVDLLNESARKAAEVSIQSIYDLSKKALDISTQIGYKKGEGTALMQIGSYFFNREQYDSALRYFFRSIDVLDGIDEPDVLLGVYGQIIWMFLYTNSPDKALKYLKIANAFVGKHPSDERCGLLYLNYGQYQLLNKNYDSSLTDFYYALYRYNRAGNTTYLARIYRFIGDVMIKKGHYRAAIFNYNEAVNVLQLSGSLADIAIIYTRIAHVYQLMGSYEDVLRYELLALKLREKVGQEEFITLSNINVGTAYMRLGQYHDAGKHLIAGLGMAQKIHKTILLESANKQLYAYMKQQKRYKEAIMYYSDYTNYHLQMKLEQRDNHISILEANRMVSDAETKNALLNQERVISQLEVRNKKLKILGGEVIFLGLLIVIQFLYTLYKKNNRRKAELAHLNIRLEEEIEERQVALRQLRQSEELYRFLAENSSDVISRLGINSKRNYISPSCKKIYGYEPEEVIAMKDIYELIEPDWHEPVRKQFEEMVKSRVPARFQYKAKRKEQPSFWAESYVNPLFDEKSGELKEMISVVRDITERKRGEEARAENARQKELLLHEIHNRVKNNFAILTSLMTMQRERIPDTVFGRAISDLQLRVRTMSLVHEQLYESEGISAISFNNYLYNLAMIVTNAYKNERITLITNITPCELPIEMVMPLGLIVNELLTNAYKYAFPGNRTGILKVELLPAGEERWELIIEDNGIGLPDGFFDEKSRSMGMQIVHILVEQIEATLGIGSENGSRFRIIFSKLQH
jgi:PAS domain S-box-containing protein